MPFQTKTDFKQAAKVANPAKLSEGEAKISNFSNFSNEVKQNKSSPERQLAPLTERRRRAAAAAERAYFGSVKRCANYWQGCFTCNQYLPETVFFCLRANMAVYGVDVPLPGRA